MGTTVNRSGESLNQYENTTNNMSNIQNTSKEIHKSQDLSNTFRGTQVGGNVRTFDGLGNSGYMCIGASCQGLNLQNMQVVPISIASLDSTVTNNHVTNTQDTNTTNNIRNITNEHNRNDDTLNGMLIRGSRFTFDGNYNTGIQEMRLNNLAMLGANGHGMLRSGPEPMLFGANGSGQRIMFL